MKVQQLAPGLWRWSVPHPDWKPSDDRPDGWPQLVGCVYYEASDATVLIDPQAPPDGSQDAARFWQALDRDVARRALPVAVLLTVGWHDRSAQGVYDRYQGSVGVRVWAHPGATGGPDCTVTDSLGSGAALPPGVSYGVLDVPDAAEAVFYIQPHHALVFGDAVLGTGSESAPDYTASTDSKAGGDSSASTDSKNGSEAAGLRLAPHSWFGDSEAQKSWYQNQFAPALTALLAQPVEVVLVSHGAPVLTRGAAALRAAIAGAGLSVSD